MGDYPPNDIDAPRRVGMHTVWFSAYAELGRPFCTCGGGNFFVEGAFRLIP